jgi:hypothetical protein
VGDTEGVVAVVWRCGGGGEFLIHVTQRGPIRLP